MGGSLGGLTAAIALRDIGCSVTVYERSRVPLAGQGAGIVLNPATVRLLTQQPAFDLTSISLTARVIRYMGPGGEILHEQPCAYRFSSYNALYRSLLERFDPERYVMAAAIVDFDQVNDLVEVTLADGRREQADLLVAADGIRSTARRLLLPDATPGYAGYVAWRGVASETDLPPAVYQTLAEAITYHLLPHSQMLIYPIPAGDQTMSRERHLNWLWYRNVPAGAALDSLMTDRDGVHRDLSLPPGMVQTSHLNQLHADAASLPPPLAQLLLATPRPFLQAIVDLEVPRLAFGRVALIGDAAFVVRPHAAAGTAKAADDAWQLAQAMRSRGGAVKPALRQWEPGQLALGGQVLARARAAGHRSQFANAWQVGDPLPFGLYTIGDSALA